MCGLIMSEFDTYYLLALRYLNIRFRSEKEIRDYLRKKILKRVQDDAVTIEAEQLIDLIVHKLKQQKFLNDEEFAKMWIRSRTEFKPKGWRLIKLELKQKGISDEIIKNQELRIKNEGEEKRDELSLAKEILEKKRKKFEPMERQERFTKAGSLLARRGFDLDVIKKAIEEVFEK